MPLPDDNIDKVKKPKEDKQNPEKIDEEIKKSQNLKKMNYLIQII